KKKDKSFYEGIIKSLQFYVETQLPVTLGRFNALMNTSSAAIDIDDNMFPS
ncbi:MAG: acyl-CoA dehydrogenase C-terminal domain-containing protein, partial [Desulfobacula sp.]|nr:acyl-CoA dehydrogenase C-terminal domain-containing protein [Desulfobacula sp.]